MDKTRRAHVLYTGRVQGVGFRFTAERTALQMGMHGYVKNLADGSVEVVCEAEEQHIEGFLSRLSEAMAAYISDCNVLWETTRGEFNSFEIRF